jgi:hypothetical protein
MGRTKPIRCRIPELLHSIGKNQQWLSEQSGYSRQRISDICTMRDEVVISLVTAYYISTIIDCLIDDLYEW